MIERVSSLPKIYIFVFSFLLCIFVLSIFGLPKVHAFSSSDVPTDIGAYLTNYDCDETGNTNGSGCTANQPTPISDSEPSACYWVDNIQNPIAAIWGSESAPVNQNSSNDTQITGVTTGDTSVSIRLNALEMNCQRYITPANCFYTNDITNCDGGNAQLEPDYPVEYKYTATSECVNSFTKNGVIIGGTGGCSNGARGTFTGPNNQPQTVTTNTGSRFWYGNLPGLTGLPEFTWTPPQGNFATYGGDTITIDLTVNANIANYWHGTSSGDAYCVETGSQDSSYPNGNCTPSGFTMDFTFTVPGSPPPPPPSSSCPDQPTESTDPSITLPSQSAGNGADAPSTPASANQPPYYQEVPTGEYYITSAGDQYGTSITSTPAIDTPASNPFTLSYANYVNEYPYDPHTTTVNYEEQYTQTIWTSEPSGYACAEGTKDGSKCEEVPLCNSKGKDCTQCTAPFVYSGGGCFTAATQEYAWESGAPNLYFFPDAPYTAPALGECLDRTFTLEPTGTAVSLGYTTSSDLPSSINVTGTVNSTFGLSGPTNVPTPHNLCQVSGITTTYIVYYTTPSDSNHQPLPGGSYSQNGSYASSPSACDNEAVPTAVSHTFSTGIPPLAYGDTVCVASISVIPDGLYMNYLGQITDGNGNLLPSGNDIPSPSDPSGTLTCTTALGAEPYFKAIDGDVMTGLDSDYVSACYDTASGIYSWSQGGTGSIGAGTTTAALATGGVNEFASGQNILNMLNPPSLTFANNPSTEYGGSYGEGGNCGGPDFYSLAQGLSGAVVCPLTIDTANVPALAVGNQLNVGLGDKYICYSTKSVTIASNITYTQPPPNTAADDLPVFEVFVKGANIDIDSPLQSGIPSAGPVTQLFGNYVAEISNGQGGTINDTGGGNIDICSTSAPEAGDDINNSCTDDRLVVNGSFTANQIDLYRSYGTLHNANTATTYGPTGSDPNDAEEFDFGPINWLVPGDNNLTIQSITSLPPVL